MSIFLSLICDGNTSINTYFSVPFEIHPVFVKQFETTTKNKTRNCIHKVPRNYWKSFTTLTRKWIKWILFFFTFRKSTKIIVFIIHTITINYIKLFMNGFILLHIFLSFYEILKYIWLVKICHSIEKKTEIFCTYITFRYS